MRIQRLELKNYRGFSDLSIDFPESGATVFIGWNGAGKTSVLEVLNNLNRLVCNYQFSDTATQGNGLSKMDVSLGATVCHVQIEVSLASEKPGQLKLKYDISSGKSQGNISSEIDNWGVEESGKAYLINEKSIPVFAFYTALRSLRYDSQVPEEGPKRYLIPQLKAYEGAWGNTLQFDHFIKWFVEEENKENREKIRLKDFDYRNPGLDAVRSAWETFFAALGERQYTNLRVEEREINQFTSVPSSLVVTKDGQDLNLSQLSDGEQLSLGMVADIAHRLVIANPGLTKPLEGEGVVLIDEIELHLHPAWQRRIVPALEKTFPGIQFILTTHSPQVVSEIARSQVFLLENFKVIREVPHTLGRDSNTLLQDVFNVPERPEAAKLEFEKLYRILDNPQKREEAKGLLQEMSQKYGADDPEIQRATLHYEFMNEA